MSYGNTAHLALTHVESVYKRFRPKNSAHYFGAHLKLRQAVERLLYRAQQTPGDLYTDSDPSLAAMHTDGAHRRDGVSSVKHMHSNKKI